MMVSLTGKAPMGKAVDGFILPTGKSRGMDQTPPQTPWCSARGRDSSLCSLQGQSRQAKMTGWRRYV
jgi:hypothetical protein